MGKRSWTDKQLREAVAEASSWRGVLRHLGLKASSGGSSGVVQRRAQSLRLDSTHFTSNRRWSDRELEEAVSVSSSWPEVAERLGLVRERRTGLRVKGYALRLGIDVSNLDNPPPRPSTGHLATPPQLSQLRKAAPSIAASWFALRGMSVALPTEPQEYDLLVTSPGGILRIQVKTSTCTTPNGNWQVGIGRRPYSADKSAGRIPYDPDTLDVFVVVNGVGEIYLIPMQAVAGLTSISLSAYQDYRRGDVASLLDHAV